MGFLAPDAADIIRWKLDEQTGVFRNTGASFPNNALTDLTASGSFFRDGNGLDSTNCLYVPGVDDFPTGSSATRNYLVGANTIAPQPPITVSAWVYLRGYNSASDKHIIGKLFRDHTITNNWATPFCAMEITFDSTGTGQNLLFSITVGPTTTTSRTISDFPVPLHQWSHIGMTHDGTNLRCYLNGCQLVTYSAGVQSLATPIVTPIVYTNTTQGGWFIGAVPPYLTLSSTNKEEASMMIQDVRIATVARSLAYFKYIYRLGVLPIYVLNAVQYYKLRAYDSGCPTPTAVIWIDTSISLTNAPALTCGGPYVDLEVLDTWYA